MTRNRTSRTRRLPASKTLRKLGAEASRVWDAQRVEGRHFCLSDEVRYIEQRAAEGTGRIVTIGPFMLFATESGDAWILDPADRLATRIAAGGAPEPIHIEETETGFAVGWHGRYDIVGASFMSTDSESGRVRTILGYPTRQIVDRIAEVFG